MVKGFRVVARTKKGERAVKSYVERKRSALDKTMCDEVYSTDPVSVAVVYKQVALKVINRLNFDDLETQIRAGMGQMGLNDKDFLIEWIW